MSVIENSAPVSVSPVPAVNVPAPENCTKLTGSVPTVDTGSVLTKPESFRVVPVDINVKSPPAISVGVSKSSALVRTVDDVLT